jgi:hypothetical protein
VTLMGLCSLLAYLVDLLFFVDTVLAGTTVHQQEQSTNNREDLEEVILGKILVRMVLMKL